MLLESRGTAEIFLYRFKDSVLVFKLFEMCKQTLHSRYHLPDYSMASTGAATFKALSKLQDWLKYLIISSQQYPVVLSDKVVQYCWLCAHLLRAWFATEISLLILIVLPVP